MLVRDVAEMAPRSSGRAGVAPFALGNERAVSLAAAAADGVAGAVGTLGALDAAPQAVWPEDPRHWPLAQVRLAGLWQQGADRLAILTAGTRWAQVSLGQRVTLEGHRVAAITADGVSLRLAQEPLFKLDWLAERGGERPRSDLQKDDLQKEDPQKARQPRKGASR